MNERSTARRTTARRRRGGAGRPRIGLALAGGGPLGAIYEIGALAALSESLRGIDLNDADVYVGVSAGGFIAAGLVKRSTNTGGALPRCRRWRCTHAGVT